MSDKLNQLAKKLDLPLDGKKIKVTAPKPKGSIEALDAKAKALREKAKGKTVEINAAKKANQEMRAKANALDPDDIQAREWYERQAVKNLAKVNKLKAERTKLQTEAQAILPQKKQYRADEATYLSDVDNVRAVNTALDYTNALVDFAAGNFPRMFEPVRKELDRVMQELAPMAAPRQFEDAAEKLLLLNSFKRNRGGVEYDVNDAIRSPVDLDYNTTILSTAQKKVIADALEAEVARLPPDMTFRIEGEEMTAKQILDEVKTVDAVMEGMGVCGIGGRKA